MIDKQIMLNTLDNLMVPHINAINKYYSSYKEHSYSDRFELREHIFALQIYNKQKFTINNS